MHAPPATHTLARELSNTVQTLRIRVDEVVDHSDLVTCLKQQQDRVATNVARAACHQHVRLIAPCGTARVWQLRRGAGLLCVGGRRLEDAGAGADQRDDEHERSHESLHGDSRVSIDRFAARSPVFTAVGGSSLEYREMMAVLRRTQA